MIDDKAVVKPVFFANWGDIFGFPLARRLLPFVINIKFLTPNVISILAFISYLLGSLFLFIDIPYHLLISTFLLPFGFLLDDLDGQVARARKLSSKIGDYLDKVLDVSKIYIVTFCLSIAVYQQTQNALYVFLGFTACFFFNYRYYIKLETVFAQVDRDKEYLVKSAKKRADMIDELTNYHTDLSKTFGGKLKSLWLQHRLIFFVDEAEFAIITAFFALINQLHIALWVLAISQVTIALFRFVQRGYQTINAPEELLQPLRK